MKKNELEKATTEEIDNLAIVVMEKFVKSHKIEGNNLSCYDPFPVMEKKWVSVNSIIDRLNYIEYQLNHNSKITCWEDCASEFREDLKR
jgi:hypothetical protein